MERRKGMRRVIDEKKMIRELEELKSTMQASSIEDRLLTGFLNYIKGQKVVDAGEYYFRHRMVTVSVLVSGMDILQVEAAE